MNEVLVGGQHRQVPRDAQLSEEGIDRRKLHAVSAAVISQTGGMDMIFTTGAQKTECGEAVDDEVASLRAGKALEEFLKDKPGRRDRLPLSQRASQRHDLRDFLRDIAPKCEGPDARFNEQAHPRSRSALWS